MLKYIEKKLENNEDVIITFIGDSITYGMNYCTSEETYVACVAKMLAEHFPNTDVVRYDGHVVSEALPLGKYIGPFVIGCAKDSPRRGSITVIRCGVGGNTVRRAINRKDDFVKPHVKGRAADIYVTMFGINDALISDPNKYVLPEKFYEDYKELYGILKEASPDARLVLMTPTYNDRGLEPKSHLEPYCSYAKKIASEFGAKLIDTHSLWMEHLVVGGEHFGQGDWLSSNPNDSCHFSPKGSYETAKFIFDEFKLNS